MKHKETMTFSTTDKLKALAITNIFETSAAFGNFAAVAVNDDGAGVSYGISQFTHASGSLAAVIEEYFARGGAVGRSVIASRTALLKDRRASAVADLAKDDAFKKALRAAGLTSEMRAAQVFVAERLYLAPAVAACAGSGFVEPLSLAVVYDSINHGSYEKIRDKVPAGLPERQWIAAYVRVRDEWLRSVPRLKKTAYRTAFFAGEIRRENWRLEPTLNVNGFRLTKDILEDLAAASGLNTSENSAQNPHETARTSDGETSVVPAETPPPNIYETALEQLDRIEAEVNKAVETYDRVESLTKKVLVRKDSARSLWTTVAAASAQAFWAAVAFFANIPRGVWLAVAVIAAALMLAYLYRQMKNQEVKK
jgi:chitosanase